MIWTKPCEMRRSAAAAHKTQIEQQKAQNDAIHQQVKSQAEIELAKVKADLDARLALIDAHIRATAEVQKTPRSHPPGARKTKDGHHDVADPKRTGKYFLMVHHG